MKAPPRTPDILLRRSLVSISPGSSKRWARWRIAFGADVFATCSQEHKSVPEPFGATAIDYHAMSVEQRAPTRHASWLLR